MQTNRSFLYGESLFSTARVVQGKILFLPQHLERLLTGANFIWGPFSPSDLEQLEQKIRGKIPSALPGEGLRISLSYDDHERAIIRSSFDLDFIEIDCLSFDRGQAKLARLKSLKSIDEQKLLPDFLKNSKRTQQTLSYLSSGYLSAEESLLFCSAEEEVFETSWANIFAVKNDILYTPPSGGSVLAGIMRQQVLEVSPNYFSEVRVESFDLGWLKTCDFVFLTNALWGVITVEKIDSTLFNLPVNDFFRFAKDIFDEEIKC